MNYFENSASLELKKHQVSQTKTAKLETRSVVTSEAENSHWGSSELWQLKSSLLQVLFGSETAS